MQTFKTSKQQRQAIKTIPVIIANVESKSKEIMVKLVYLIYIKLIMLRVKNSILSALPAEFPLIQHIYPTNFRKNKFKESKLNLMITEFGIQGAKQQLENGLMFLAKRS